MRKTGVFAREAVIGFLVIVVGIASSYFLYNHAIEFWSIGLFVLLSGLALLMYSIADNLFMRNFDTEVELRKGNVAYALRLLGYAIIIAACVSAV